MNKRNEDDDVIDDDVTEREDDLTENEEDDTVEETYLEMVAREVLEEHKDLHNAFISDPQNPEEVSENESIKKFIALKVRAKVLESFECRQQWEDDEQLTKLFRACKRAMKQDPDLDALVAMKHVLRKDNSIKDVIERALEEEMEVDDEDDSDE